MFGSADTRINARSAASIGPQLPRKQNPPADVRTIDVFGVASSEDRVSSGRPPQKAEAPRAENADPAGAQVCIRSGKEHVGFAGISRFQCHASRKTVVATGNMNRTDGRLRSRAGPGRLERTRRRMRALDVGNDTSLAFALGRQFDNVSSEE
jgi:hypothetical protein